MDPQLSEAALAGDVTMLHEILENRSTALHKVSIATSGETPLHIAALLGHLEFVKAVLARNPALAREPDEQGSSPLHLAAANGHIQVVEELLKVGSDLCLLRDKGGRIPVHVAAMKGRVDVLAKLIDKKPESIRKVTDGGDTVLHLSVKANQLQVVEFLVGRQDVNDLLNFQDHKGNTVLHLATASKQIQATRLLLKRSGIDVNATNRREATALDVLLESPREHGDVQLEHIILEAGGRLGRCPSLPLTHDVTNLTNLAGEAGPEDLKKPTTQPVAREESSKGLDDRRNALMVVATLIASITFQAVQNPLHDKKDDFIENNDLVNYSPNNSPVSIYEPQTSKMSVIGLRSAFKSFMLFDVIALSASMSIILVLLLLKTTDMNAKNRKLLMAIMARVMCVSIFATVMAYFQLVLFIAPVGFFTFWMLTIFLRGWVLIMALALSAQLVQILVHLLEKMLKPKIKRMYRTILFIMILAGACVVTQSAVAGFSYEITVYSFADY